MSVIKVIGFDADDTLWENAVLFREAQQLFCSWMQPYATPEESNALLEKIEIKNLPWFGYGVMAYMLSMMEAATTLSQGKVSGTITAGLIAHCKRMLDAPVRLYPGVAEVLPLLKEQYRLIVVTKGDLLDQERKLKRSGLLPLFHHIEIVSDKQTENYKRLLAQLDLEPESFMMVGNSLRSDIHPVLELGGNAVHIPQREVWAHENAEKPDKPYFELTSIWELPGLLQSKQCVSVGQFNSKRVNT